MNILGSKIYIFGGQVEGFFFNDLVAFDLNALQQASNRWEVLIQNTIDGGPPHGQIPPARTNHTMITWGDRLYLFGGTDGVRWFNDVWSYSPHTNSWTQFECIGYIPSPREGHAAALVGDVMYIFGGRTEAGTDLGDLAAFRISSRRWYTFQNMGPSPSPRSGHSMTTLGKQIVVLAGEPSSAPRDPVELGLAYYLDTSKIRYPADASAQTSTPERAAVNRRPSLERTAIPAGTVRNLQHSADRERGGSGDARVKTPDHLSRLPRAQGQLPAPTGPPPQAPGQPRTNGTPPASRQPTRSLDRTRSPSIENERSQTFESGPMVPLDDVRNSPQSREVRMPTSPSSDQDPAFFDAQQRSDSIRRIPETYQPSQDQSAEPFTARTTSRSQQARFDESERTSEDRTEPISAVRKMSEETNEGPQDSGIGSSPALTQQYDTMARELEQARQRNAWYASELALAKKSGYQSRSTDSPVLDERADEAFSEEDRPLIEAMLKMRAELAKMQSTIDGQSKSAAERIAGVEKQRDTAINEAVTAKVKLAALGTSQPESDYQDAQHNDLRRRLASSLEAQSELSKRVESLILELEGEKKARELAENTAESAQKRVAELDVYRQQHSTELEGLRTELHETQSQSRDLSAKHTDIIAQHQLLTTDKNELNAKLERALSQTQDHNSVLTSLKEAFTASTDKAQLLEQKLETERSNRETLERDLRELRLQYDRGTSELESTSKKLRDTEEISQKHAEEARTHRQAVLAGLDKVTNVDAPSTRGDDERVTALQQQVEAANAIVRQNQEAADSASEKLRRAEERIAGLEAYQEQASREGLAIRKQLQAAMKENQGLSAEKADLAQKHERHMLETNALSVQHASLKDILGERGVNLSERRRSRAPDSPSRSQLSTPDLQRVKDLEQQLEATMKNHDEMKAQFEEVSTRDDKMKREYEDKLTALDNDHQAAVKYLRGTEKMLSKMKQELQRVKNENGELKKKLEKAKDGNDASRDAAAGTASAEWNAEREKLQKEVADVQANLHRSASELETRIAMVQEQLHTTESELEQTKTLHAGTHKDLTELQTAHSQSRTEMERLQKENTVLEERARDAENKVQLLLDQVEHSVDNYRRQSRISAGGPSQPTANGTSHVRHGSGISDAPSAVSEIPTSNTSIAGDETSTNGDSDATPSGGAADERNSLALDSLANELDALRTHWQTTNKAYRLSDRFDFERTPTSSQQPAGGALSEWRRGLDLGDDDDDDDDHTRTSNSATPNGEEKSAS